MIVGSRLSHYTIEAVLGQGGMGTVYRARDTHLDRTVAIKILSSDAAGAGRSQLLREARAASALSHPHIVTIHAIEQQDALDFIVMEHIDGRPLASVIGSGLPVDTVVDYGLQISSALASAHASGVVHRDVKPGNVMINAAGQLKVLDFGLARRTAAPDDLTRRLSDATLSGPDALVGTAGYIAPEQITGHPADARGDVFALGVLLYQMLSGRAPFAANSIWASIERTMNSQAAPLGAIRPDAPPALLRIVERCLAKDPAARYQSGTDVHDALTKLRAERQPGVKPRTRIYAAWLVAAVVASAAMGALIWSRVSARRVQSAAATAAEIRQRAVNGDLAGAYRLVREAAERAPNDPQIAEIWRTQTAVFPVSTVPTGAQVELRAYDGGDEGWINLGRTPLPAGTRVPPGQVRWRIALAGYETLEASPNEPPFEFTLARAGTVPPGMTLVPAGELALESTNETVSLPDFWIDRFEVTNRQFKQFVDAGGYQKQEYWPTPFVIDRRTIDWAAAIQQFRDTTGRPGPSTWELGTYPQGQDDYPVSGVSWYEAAAYAAFAGKSLPTAYHWYRASGAFGIFSEIVRFSNFGGKGTAAVGSYQGLGPYGTYDMAGNVKEWCWNQSVRGLRYVLGGAFNDAAYQFRDEDARQPMERSAGFGFRCIKPIASADAKLLQPIVTLERDPSTLKPVNDTLYAAYQSLYDYDPVPLNGKILETDESQPEWVRQRVEFAAAYGGERVPAELFLPRTSRPPYQALVYFPGSDAVTSRSSRAMYLQWVDFLVRSGRAVIYPIYQSTYERHVERRGQNTLREISIQRGKDLRRAVDYLQSRPEIDGTKIGGYGLSLGAQLMPLFLAIEPRLRTGVLLSGGFETWTIPPEIDPVNFARHVKQPVLMVNGRDDFDLPYASAQVPLFNMLGTAAADKRHAVFEGGHLPQKPQLVYKEILDWLDRYLGPVTATPAR